MGKETGIGWTDATFNAWWGCTKVSKGCTHCYADTLSTRFGFDIWGPKADRRTFGEKHWNDPVRWNREAQARSERMRVFCGSMCDIFEDHPTANQEREKLWPLIDATPWLDWQLLTKRPENMLRFAPDSWAGCWPENVWAMTSVENEEVKDARLSALVQVPAVVRGVSAEPLIGPVDFSSYLLEIDWIIVGGESGPGAREMKLEWARDIQAQAQNAGVAFFMKQTGTVLASVLGLAHKKGEDPEEWPENLRVQEFPTARPRPVTSAPR